MAETAAQAATSRLLDYCDKQLRRFSKNLDKLFESEEGEPVHQIRVASRRLAEPLRIIGQLVSGRYVDRADRLLRRTRRALRKVRDLDVLLGSLCAPTNGNILAVGDLEHLEEKLHRRRQRALSKARRTCARLGAHRLADFTEEFKDELRRRQAQDADIVIEQGVEESLRTSTQELQEKDPRPPISANIHESRIAVKRMRYSAELARDVIARSHDALLCQLEHMQELLGLWNDHVVAVRKITAIARRPGIVADRPAWAAHLLSYAAVRALAAEDTRAKIIVEWSALEAVVKDGAAGAARLEIPSAAPSAALTFA